MTIALKCVVGYESFGFGKEFPRNLFWACFAKGMSIWHIRRKGMQKSKIYFH
jgi:hypothetical protein